MAKKLVVAWLFGGRSTEHEVSVITALQAFEHLDKVKYQVIPIYVSKAGDFYTSPKFLDLKNFQDVDHLLLFASKIILGRKNDTAGFFTQGLFPTFTPLDLAFPLFHGSFGEDGSIQGLLETYQLPYVGFNVSASAVAMDKALAKAVFLALKLPIGKFVSVNRADFYQDGDKTLNLVEQTVNYPVFVKPQTLGSSIGVNRARDRDSLSFAIEVASTYCDKVLIEEAFEDCIEVNCAALGYRDIQASVCEQPVKSQDLLSFADKYQRGGGKGSKGAGMASMTRVIPAPISDKLTREIQETTIKIFKALDGCGVARVDYFVDQKRNKFWVNEINSPPGSLAFYLWGKSGIKYSKLLDLLISYTLKRAADQQKTQYTFESGLLSEMAKQGGTKY